MFILQYHHYFPLSRIIPRPHGLKSWSCTRFSDGTIPVYVVSNLFLRVLVPNQTYIFHPGISLISAFWDNTTASWAYFAFSHLFKTPIPKFLFPVPAFKGPLDACHILLNLICFFHILLGSWEKNSHIHTRRDHLCL